ncbi:hypothetical protein R1sor_015682 [Riccia sorocarpa]|uniref:Protein kinase domain-containing protein n=1 Tax=Riccia sorocarpa TaxID=122646 RepID=A0ABD3HCX3_9MARC
MPPFTSRDKKKAKRDSSSGSPEAEELIPIVPPGESSKTKKTKSGPKTTIDKQDERKRENAIIRHAWFKCWTNERPVWVFPSTLWEPRYMDPIKERARVWQEWFKKPRELSNGNSLSFKYKECEPMFDNKIRWINFNTWLTPMVPRTRLGAGLYGTVYKVGVMNSSLVADLGSHEVVFYVAKLLNDTRWSNARDEMLKELFAFTVNHPTVVRPVAAFSDPKTPGLLFPWWNGTAIKKWYEIERRLRGKVSQDGKTRLVSEDIGKHDNLETDGDRINRKLVFVGIGDLGYAQTTQDAAVGKCRYNHLDKAPQKWTAPELTEEKAYTGDDGKQYITYWTKSTDVFTIGWLIREICGDFFIDMSREEKLEYDREKWAMGYPTTSEPPHQTHRLRLKEALDAMVYLNISSLRDHRKTAEYWAHYFIDQLMVDPTICRRPIESTKRAAKHPDGPRDIKENKW